MNGELVMTKDEVREMKMKQVFMELTKVKREHFPLTSYQYRRQKIHDDK